MKKERQEITCDLCLNNGQIMLKTGEKERERGRETRVKLNCGRGEKKIILGLERTSFFYGTVGKEGKK